jgi:FMN reductase
MHREPLAKHARGLRVVGIGGSLRPESYSYLALEHAMNLLSVKGCQTRILDLRKLKLPFCDGNQASPAHPGVAEMRAAVSNAHVILLATPEYHGSISGVLKNALDLLSEEHLKGRLVGLISVLGGPAAGNALFELSRIMRSCHAWVLPQHIAVGHANRAFAAQTLQDETLQARFDEFTTSLVTSAFRICELAEPEATQGYLHENFKSHSRFRFSLTKRARGKLANNQVRRARRIERPILP